MEVLTILQKKSKRIREDKEKARAAGDSDKQWIGRTPHNFFDVDM